SGDDLWILECASSAEVSRIISLNRRLFGRLEILMGSWTKSAGRSRLAWDSNVVWLSVRGIPLHLRSLALAQSVGEVCGEFLESAVGADLSSLRVKVRIKGGLPEVIPLSVGGEIFPVTVVPEVGFPLTHVMPKEDKMMVQKGKGACIGRARAFVFENSVTTPGECSSPAGMFLDGAMDGDGRAAPEGNSLVMLTRQVARAEQMRGQKGVALTGVEGPARVSESIVVSVQNGKKLFGEEAAPFLGFCLTSDGLWIGNIKLGVNEWALGKRDVARPLWSCAFLQNGLFGWLQNLRAFASSNRGPNLFLDKMRDFFSLHETGQELVPSCFSGNRLSNEEEERGDKSLWIDLQRPSQLKVGTQLIGGPEDLGQASSEEVCLVEAVQKVASIICLDVNNSLEEGSKAAVEVAKEVRRRKSPAVQQTWTDRELRRLGPPPEPQSVRQSKRRGDRCVLPPPSSNEF
ncbi:hypothetical protein LINPERPRIM_LOCUS9091, partial [Linum perenne]